VVVRELTEPRGQIDQSECSSARRCLPAGVSYCRPETPAWNREATARHHRVSSGKEWLIRPDIAARNDVRLRATGHAGGGRAMVQKPFTAGEWDAVRWAAGAITEAAQAGDADARAARFSDLQSILVELRDKHGKHPLLWETEADFTPDPEAAAELYRQAEELGRPGEARDPLLACREELPWAGEADCTAWATLLAACPPDFPTGLTARQAAAAGEPAA